MKKSYVVSIILAFAMLGVGLAFPLPDKNVHVSSYSYSNNAKWGGNGVEYVGGDAYNYQIEASLTAGWVSGVMAFKGILISSGIMLFAITFMLKTKDDVAEEMLYAIKQSNSQDSKATSTVSNKHTYLSESQNIVKYDGDTWRCPECDKLNPLSSRTCKDCGYQK